jgi:hypothetical protein
MFSFGSKPAPLRKGIVLRLIWVGPNGKEAAYRIVSVRNDTGFDHYRNKGKAMTHKTVDELIALGWDVEILHEKVVTDGL